MRSSRSSRSGSPSTSMAATLLPTIVKPMTATCCPRRLGTGVGAQDHVGVEHRDEPVEVPRAAGGEERVDDLALCGEARIRHRGGSAHTAPRAAGELPRGLGRAVDHRRDLVERNGEDVVEHESETLGRAERLENDQQGQPDRVGHERLLLGLGRIGRADDRLGHVRRSGHRPARRRRTGQRATPRGGLRRELTVRGGLGATRGRCARAAGRRGGRRRRRRLPRAGPPRARRPAGRAARGR